MALPHPGAKSFGVTRFPVPLGPFDMQAVRDGLPPAFQLEQEHITVRLEFDVDETGAVTAVDVVAPRVLPPNVHVVAMLVDDAGARAMPAPTEPPPPLRAALIAAARKMRFRPAQRDGHPAAIRGMPLTVECSVDGLGGASR